MYTGNQNRAVVVSLNLPWSQFFTRNTHGSTLIVLNFCVHKRHNGLIQPQSNFVSLSVAAESCATLQVLNVNMLLPFTRCVWLA